LIRLTTDYLSFFRTLACEWKGWEGVRKWSSLEGEFELLCEHDGLGHISAEATIHSNRHGHGWTGQIRFDMAAGELEGIAAGVSKFFPEFEIHTVL